MASPAPTPTTTNSTSPALTATYTSPTNVPFTHSTPLPSLSSTSSTGTAQKTQYLSTLRQATSQMQEVINKELTARMEEDNARAAEGANGKGKVKGVDENKEEENYGEEVVDEED
ncbi:Gon7-domain-containing protein [Cadophora sp. DSE1049]|nr:Gon7-domain-containing protein [Cadophora sp. DSE1049]